MYHRLNCELQQENLKLCALHDRHVFSVMYACRMLYMCVQPISERTAKDDFSRAHKKTVIWVNLKKMINL